MMDFDDDVDGMELVGAGYGYCGGLIGTYVCPSLMELEDSVLPPDLLKLMLSYVDYFWWVPGEIRYEPFPWADDWRDYGDF